MPDEPHDDPAKKPPRHADSEPPETTRLQEPPAALIAAMRIDDHDRPTIPTDVRVLVAEAAEVSDRVTTRTRIVVGPDGIPILIEDEDSLDEVTREVPAAKLPGDDGTGEAK